MAVLFIKILFCIMGFCEIVVISSFCRERWNRFEMCPTILDEVHVLESCLCSILFYVLEVDECESCLCLILVLESCLLLFSQIGMWFNRIHRYCFCFLKLERGSIGSIDIDS